MDGRGDAIKRKSPGASSGNIGTIILRRINLNTPTNGFLGTINLW